MTIPGFTAGRDLATPMDRSGSGRVRSGRRPEVTPAAALVYTGHCGCLADQLFGLPCVCVETGHPDPGATEPHTYHHYYFPAGSE